MRIRTLQHHELLGNSITTQLGMASVKIQAHGDSPGWVWTGLLRDIAQQPTHPSLAKRFFRGKASKLFLRIREPGIEGGVCLTPS
jgi:hypothetical protein